MMKINYQCFKEISENDLSNINGGDLGKVLRFYRKKSKFSADEMAKMLYVSSTTLSHYENNRRRPTLEFIRDFSALLYLHVKVLKNHNNLNIIIVFLGFLIISASIIFLSDNLSIMGSVTGFLIIFFSKYIAKYFNS